MLAQVVLLGAALGEPQERHLGDLVVGDVDGEPVAERAQHVLAHLLLLMGDVLALAGLAHPVALDGLGQDHRRRADVVHRRLVRRVDLGRVVPAAAQRPDLVVGHVRDQVQQLGVLAEEVLADVGAVLGLEVLVLAVDALLHALEQQPRLVRGDQRVPPGSPDHLDHVPAGAAEHALQLLDDLPVAAHRAVEALQVAVDDEDQVVQLLPAGQRDRAQRLGLVHLAVAEERPHVPVRGVGELPVVQVLEEPGLVDGHQRAQPHRHRGELPVIRHQPRMRIGRQAAAADLLPEPEQLLLGQPPLHERARVDPGRAVALHEHQVAAVALGRRVPEVVEPGVVQRRRGLEARDVPAQLGGLLVGAQHDRHRVPPDQRPDPVLDLPVTRMRRLPRAAGSCSGTACSPSTAPAPRCAGPRRRSSSSRNAARSAPSNSITESNASRHSLVSTRIQVVDHGVPPSGAAGIVVAVICDA